MTQTDHDLSKPPIDRELSLDELDHVAGGAGGWLSAPSNFVNGFTGGAIYGTGAKDSQIAMFGDRNDIGFRPGVETGMMFNMALGPVGSLISSGANAVEHGVSAGVAGVGNAYQAAHDYLNPSPGNGAPGDSYLPAHVGSDGAVVPGQFVAPTPGAPGSLSDQAGYNSIGHEPVQADPSTADHAAGSQVPESVQNEFGVSPGGTPQGTDHSADHTEQGAPAGSEPAGSNDHAGEQGLSGTSDPGGPHSNDNTGIDGTGNDHNGNDFNGNDFNGNDYGGSQFAGGDYGGGDYGGGDFGGGDFG